LRAVLVKIERDLVRSRARLIVTLFDQLADKLGGERVLVQVDNTLGDGEVVWVWDFVVVEQIENETEDLYQLVHSLAVST
jgi:hypothetical protein